MGELGVWSLRQNSDQIAGVLVTKNSSTEGTKTDLSYNALWPYPHLLLRTNHPSSHKLSKYDPRGPEKVREFISVPPRNTLGSTVIAQDVIISYVVCFRDCLRIRSESHQLWSQSVIDGKTGALALDKY